MVSLPHSCPPIVNLQAMILIYCEPPEKCFYLFQHPLCKFNIKSTKLIFKGQVSYYPHKNGDYTTAVFVFQELKNALLHKPCQK